MSIILKQDCHCAPEVCQTHRLDILSIDENSSFSWVVYASYKLKNRALSGSVRTDDDLLRITKVNTEYIPKRKHTQS